MFRIGKRLAFLCCASLAGPVAAAQAESLTLTASDHPTAGSPVTITASGSTDYQVNSLSLSYSPPGSSASCGSGPPPGSVTLLSKALPAGAFSVAGRFTPAHAGTYGVNGELTGSSSSGGSSTTKSGSTTSTTSSSSSNTAADVQCLSVKVAPAAHHSSAPSSSCHVPTLSGLMLKTARHRLGAAHCKLGKVKHKRYKHKPKGKTVVLSQASRRGKVLKPGAAVGVTLGVAPHHTSKH
ncbi:MAG: hypothetical protein DLM64_13960 [Solirubrobacterales bacterium]|nr:MAG: hypothetical protein DLM64_13960 [Solirubrobacterales bacterium]